MIKAIYWLYQRRRAVMYVALAILLICVGFWLWAKFHPAQPITAETQKQVQTPAGIESASNAAAFSITTSQARDAAQQIATRTKPDSIIHTTGAQMPVVIIAGQKATDSQASIVTDPAHPNTVPVVAPGQVVDLNVYNIKAYPKHLLEATYYYSNAGDVAYLTRVTVFKQTGYIGPVLSYNGSKVNCGVRLSIPF